MTDHFDSNRIVKTADQARAGVTGHHARYVLFIGTAAVVASFAVLWFYYFYDIDLIQ